MFSFFKKLFEKEKTEEDIEISHYIVMPCCADCGNPRSLLPSFLPEMIDAPILSWKCCPKCGSTKPSIEKVGRVKYVKSEDIFMCGLVRVFRAPRFIEFVPKELDNSSDK